MVQPTPYAPTYSFTDHASGNPSAQPPGVPLDIEFDNIASTVQQIINNLSLIQRDDTTLRSNSVGVNQLDGAALALITAGTFGVKGVWQTGQSYALGDFVAVDDLIYVVVIPHVSDVFATDFGANKLVRAFNPPTVLPPVIIPSTAFATLVQLKAADPVLLSYSLTGGSNPGVFFYETANAPYIADDVNVIKLDNTALSVGALVRQTFTPGAFGADLVVTDTAAAARTELGVNSAAELAASGGSALVGFSHANTYAAGTAGAKFKGTVSVKDAPYNAVGNGVADDTAAIQAAIDAIAEGEILFFPVGEYLVTQKLTVEKDIRLLGAGELGSVIIAQHGTANTDLLEVGPVDTTRVGVEIAHLGFQFKNTNTRHVISTVGYTSKFTVRNIDVRSFGSNGGIIATGAAINFNGQPDLVPGGLNDWARVEHCYLAFCTNGIIVDALNVINMRITQNTTASIQLESILWLTGGQSQIDHNTFQYSNLAANGTTPAYTIRFYGGASLSNAVVNNVTFGPGNSFQANGGAGLGPAVANTWEMHIENSRSMTVIGNQFAGASPSVNFGAFHAIKVSTSYGWIKNNTFQNYTRTGGTDTTPGPVLVDATSLISYQDNDNIAGVADFLTTTSVAALNTNINGSLSAKQTNNTNFFKADAVTGITDVNFLRIAGGNTIGNLASGVAQMGSGSATVSLSWCTASTKILVSLTVPGTPAEYLTVDSANNGNFVVKSSNAASGNYFYWLAIG